MLLSVLPPPVLVVYASQQGNSKAIAEDLCEECANHDISATITCISDLGKNPSHLLNKPCIIFIAATTGDGEPPDTARKFWRILNKSFTVAASQSDQTFSSNETNQQPQKIDEAELTRTSTDELLKTKEHLPASTIQSQLVLDIKETLDTSRPSELLPNTLTQKDPTILVESAQNNQFTSLTFKDKNLSELYYTVLGLGDTNYTNFCNFGKNLDEKLHKLGAKRFYSCGWADDGTGLELVIEPWLEGLWDALAAHISLVASDWRLRETDPLQEDGCGDSTTDKRSVVEGCDDFNPEIQKLEEDKETRNNAEVSRIEKMIGEKCDSDVVVEDGRCVVDGASWSESENNIAVPIFSSNELDGGKELEGQQASNNTCPSVEKDFSADELSREIVNLSVSDSLKKVFSYGIDNAWKENHTLLQCGLSSDSKLSTPKIPAYGSIILDYEDSGICSDNSNHVYQNSASLPSAASPVYDCNIVVFRKLSEGAPGKEVKKVVEVVAQLPLDCTLDYEPGDSLALLVRNDSQEVSLIMELLGIPSPDQVFKLSNSPSAKKALPAHLPSRCTAREIFTSCVDYKCLPKKAMLLLLLDSATDPHEKRCLQELVCREGADLYKKKVLDTRLTFFDVLSAFSSCRPKLASLLEVLPRLIPRAYSLTSSPLNTQRRISFAYSLTVIPATPHVFRERYGVCTGLLDRLSEQFGSAQNIDREEPISPRAQLSLYLRSSKSFRLPDDPAIPIILIGPGCGVAPLVGFLRHRQLQIASKELNAEQFGTSWLFFGCRYAQADELFMDELEEFHRLGVLTHLRKCFSREPRNKEGVGCQAARYVQDAVRAEGEALFAALTEREAKVYVCGDATNMAKDVLATFGELMAERLGDVDQGILYVAQMQKDGRYLQDVWT